MSAYPPDVSGAALCYVDGGHHWNGGSQCAECGARLRCGCGQFVRENDLDAHCRIGVCPQVTPCPAGKGCESAEDCERNRSACTGEDR